MAKLPASSFESNLISAVVGSKSTNQELNPFITVLSLVYKSLQKMSEITLTFSSWVNRYSQFSNLDLTVSSDLVYRLGVMPISCQEENPSVGSSKSSTDVCRRFVNKSHR